MTHDSLIRSQSGRMSPAALALAIGLHGLVAAALWWSAPLRTLDHAETPIMVSVEPEPLSAGGPVADSPAQAGQVASEPSPTPTERVEPTATSPPAAETEVAAAAPPSAEPPAPSQPPPPPRSAEPAPPAPPPEAAQNEPVVAPAPPAPAPEPSATQTATATPEPVAEAETETTWQTDVSSWKPQVTVEPSLTPPPPRPARPAARPPTTPRTAQAPGQRLQDYPPQTSSLGGPSTGSLDQAMGDGGARNDYLSRVYRHIDPHRDYPAAARAARQHGRVVTRVTISRAGELLDLRLDRSSGWPLIDNAEMAAIRRAMPLPPVPAGMRGDPIVLVLPMNY